MTIAHQAIKRQARRTLNPSKIGVSLAWYDRTVGKFYISAHFPAEQYEVDDALFMPDNFSNRIGSGETIEAAIGSVLTIFFGDL